MPSDHPALRPIDADHATPGAMILHYAALVVSNTGALHGSSPLSREQFGRAIAAKADAGSSLLLLVALRDGRDPAEVARELYDFADSDGQDTHEMCWELLAATGHDPQVIAAEGERIRAEATVREYRADQISRGGGDRG